MTPLPEVNGDLVNALRQLEQYEAIAKNEKASLRWVKSGLVLSLAVLTYTVYRLSLIPQGTHWAPWGFVLGLSVVAGVCCIIGWVSVNENLAYTAHRLRDSRYVHENVMVGGDYLNVKRYNVLDGGREVNDRNN